METLLLRAFQRQVMHSCRAVLFGLADINAPGSVESGRVWYGVHSVVVGAANTSKALWGGPRQYESRAPLRESLGVTDDSPLRDKSVRHDYEHMDERIDTWWRESKGHNIMDSLVAPRGAIIGLDERDIFRWIDPETGDVIFWGTALNIPSVALEAKRVLDAAEIESAKPHWDMPPSPG